MTDKILKVRAYFKAKYLHAMRGILDGADETNFYRPTGLYVEPAPIGGVNIIATDGKVAAVIHDAQGEATQPFRAILPKWFRDRAAPPAPVKMFNQGDHEGYPLPEWAQPGEIHLFGICALILPQMLHPEEIGDPENASCLANARVETSNHWRMEDYRVEEKTIPWRGFFNHSAGAPAAIGLSPEVFARLDPLKELATPEMHTFRLEFGGQKEPILVTLASVDNCVACVMPMHLCDRPGDFPFLREVEKTEAKEAN